MAEELGTPFPKNITTIKPSGTLSKIMDTSEGMHKPLGKYIFNNVAFSKYDELLPYLKDSNYEIFNHPYDDTAVLVTLPVKYENVDFNIVEDKEVNHETAIEQLERYKMLMQSYCQQNVSATISYSDDEILAITDWLWNNWDNYVAVSFLKRNDPSKTAKDLGFPYLPQEVVTKEEYEKYINRLKPVDFSKGKGYDLDDIKDEECAGGICPIR